MEIPKGGQFPIEIDSAQKQTSQCRLGGPRNFVTLWSRDSMKITVKACQLVQIQLVQ
jgi:hypothetical protein